MTGLPLFTPEQIYAGEADGFARWATVGDTIRGQFCIPVLNLLVTQVPSHGQIDPGNLPVFTGIRATPPHQNAISTFTGGMDRLHALEWAADLGILETMWQAPDLRKILADKAGWFYDKAFVLIERQRGPEWHKVPDPLDPLSNTAERILGKMGLGDTIERSSDSPIAVVRPRVAFGGFTRVDAENENDTLTIMPHIMIGADCVLQDGIRLPWKTTAYRSVGQTTMQNFATGWRTRDRQKLAPGSTADPLQEPCVDGMAIVQAGHMVDEMLRHPRISQEIFDIAAAELA